MLVKPVGLLVGEFNPPFVNWFCQSMWCLAAKMLVSPTTNMDKHGLKQHTLVVKKPNLGIPKTELAKNSF